LTSFFVDPVSLPRIGEGECHDQDRAMITSRHVEAFERDGFVQVDGMFSRREAEILRAHAHANGGPVRQHLGDMRALLRDDVYH